MGGKPARPRLLAKPKAQKQSGCLLAKTKAQNVKAYPKKLSCALTLRLCCQNTGDPINIVGLERVEGRLFTYEKVQIMTHASYGTVIDVVTSSGWQEPPTPQEHRKICQQIQEIEDYEKDPYIFVLSEMTNALYTKFIVTKERQPNKDEKEAIWGLAAEAVDERWVPQKGLHSRPGKKNYCLVAEEIFGAVEERAVVERGNRYARNAIIVGASLVVGLANKLGIVTPHATFFVLANVGTFCLMKGAWNCWEKDIKRQYGVRTTRSRSLKPPSQYL